MRKVLLVRAGALLLLLAIAVRPVAAFKIDTHIWIAQQVLNDAADGVLEIQLAPQGTKRAETVRIPLAAHVRRALERFPESFRMGSVGPDAFPDVLVGQMIIHPSVPHGWGTADWIRFLNDQSTSDEQRAFAFGHLIHAASDVFAHTYVNRYAGDVFELAHEAASIRHVRLENFISQFTPDLLGRNGRNLGPASGAVRRGDGALAIPADFVRDKIYFSDAALAELDRSGKVPHIGHIRGLRGRLADALESNGFVDNLEALALQVVLKAAADIELSQEDAKRVREWSEKIHNLGDFSEESLQFMNQLDQTTKDIHVFTRDQLRGFFTLVEGAVGEVQRARADLENKRQQLRATTRRWENELDTKIVNSCREVCNNCPKISLACRVTCNTVCDAVTVVNDVKQRLKGEIDNLENEINRLANSDQDRLKKVHDAIIAGMDTVTKAIDLKIAANQIALEYFSRDQSKSPLRRILQNWHDDINTAMSALVVANGEAMVNTITAGKAQPLKPYTEWFDCYAKGIVGIPILVTNGICRLKVGIEDFKKALDDLEANIAKLTPVTEELQKVKSQLERRVNELKDQIVAQGTDVIIGELGKLAGIDLLLWKEIFTTPTTAEALNAEFAADRNGDGLLLVPDIADRVRAEMHLSAAGRFDPKAFPPVANALTLSKLALLDAAGLKELSRRAGLVDTIFGEYLFEGDEPEAGNVLYGFAKNIDGNHQWQRLSSPHPRQNGPDAGEFIRRRDDATRAFTYVDDRCEPTKGMRMWLDPLARPMLFERLFLAPVAAGVDLPEALSPAFKPVLPASYPNTVTRKTPWGADGAELDLARLYRDTQVRGRAAKGMVVSLSRKSTGGDVALGSGTADNTGHWQFTASLSLTRSEWLSISYTTAAGKPVGELATTYCSTPGSGGEVIQSYVTVVQSHSLWRIAELMTGNGENYVTLYHKNRHLIEDQDVIFPGQILLVPNDNEWKFQ